MTQFFQWLTESLRGVRLWFVVLPWQQAVRVRCGKYARLFGPGWHWRLPVLDDTRVFNNRLRLAPFPTVTVTTPDGRTMTASGIVAFRLVDPLRAMLALQQPESTCASLAMAAVARYLSTTPLPSIDVAAAERAAAEGVLVDAPGITVEFVRVLDFASVRTYRLLQENWRPSTNTDAAL